MSGYNEAITVYRWDGHTYYMNLSDEMLAEVFDDLAPRRNSSMSLSFEATEDQEARLFACVRTLDDVTRYQLEDIHCMTPRSPEFTTASGLYLFLLKLREDAVTGVTQTTGDVT